MKKIFLIAGEASGDSHGARLVRELKLADPGIEFYGLGGNKMKEAGVRISTDLTSISALGLTDVLSKYFTFRKIFYSALKQVRELKPDLVILIDYPGFNLRFAKRLNKTVPVIYYICPQIWAWGRRRIKVIRKFIDKLIVFFPFEKALYDSENIPCAYVGHPLTDEIPGAVAKSLSDDEVVLGLLPGSREKEVKRILPALLSGAKLIVKKHPNIKLLLSESNNIPESIYQKILEPYKATLNLRILRGQPYEVIKASDVLAVASGTATLETALHGCPFILVYKAAWLTYILGRLLIRIPFLGIVNVLAEKRIVPELIQAHLTAQNISREIENLIFGPEERQKQVQAFQEVRGILTVGNSAGLSAQEVLHFLKSQATATTSSKKI